MATAVYATARTGETAPAGLFASVDDLHRAAESNGPDRAALMARAEAALDADPAPFIATDMSALRFGWSEPATPPDDTLREAVDRLHRESDRMRDLALAFALAGDARHARAAERMMLLWAKQHTPVNFYDFEPDFVRARHLGATEGFHSDRPWNFGLDAMWQAYGLVNASDALLLLRHGGHDLSAPTERKIRDWLLRLVDAVNASFHAWTRWADANASGAAAFHAPSAGEEPSELSAGFVRHRSDNHLSWALVGLLAGAVALEDPKLADYALTGGIWTDRRAGAYANPSALPDVIDWAIEGAPDVRGRLFEERIGRARPLPYALFHLEAMTLAARIAALHFDVDLWRVEGRDGGGLLDAFRRYGEMLHGERPAPGDERDGRWLFALSPEGYGGSRRTTLLEARPLPARMTHAIGPARLLFGR